MSKNGYVARINCGVSTCERWQYWVSLFMANVWVGSCTKLHAPVKAELRIMRTAQILHALLCVVFRHAMTYFAASMAVQVFTKLLHFVPSWLWYLSFILLTKLLLMTLYNLQCSRRCFVSTSRSWHLIFIWRSLIFSLFAVEAQIWQNICRWCLHLCLSQLQGPLLLSNHHSFSVCIPPFQHSD